MPQGYIRFPTSPFLPLTNSVEQHWAMEHAGSTATIHHKSLQINTLKYQKANNRVQGKV